MKRSAWLGGVTLLALASLAVLVPMFGSDDPNVPRLHPGLDIQGGTVLVFRVDVGETDDIVQAAEQVVEVLTHRYDDSGISSHVRAQGDTIRVELADAAPDVVASARSLAASNARLELRLVDEDARTLDDLVLPANVRRETEPVGDQTGTFLVAAGESGRQRLLELAGEHSSRVALARVSPWEAAFDPQQEQWRTYLVKEVEITGADVVDAFVSTSPESPEPSVSITFNDRAAATLLDMTQNVGTRLAIILNDEVMSAPVIASPIPGGRAQITLGQNDSVDALLTEAQDLVVMLRAGALPDPLIFEREDRIEPTQPKTAWAILGFGMLVFLVFAGVGVARRDTGGLALALPLVMMPVSFAALAVMHATATMALFAGIVLAGFVALIASHVACKSFDPESPRASRILTTLIPCAACACGVVVSGIVYALGSGPLRGAAVGTLMTCLVGAPLAAMWMAGSLSFGRRPGKSG